MAESPVLIVGGGLGGLTLSLCLAKIGISSKVFERRSQLSENGAGIQLSPNCLRVYDYLGMVNTIAEIAHEPSHIEFREWRQNRILSKLELADFREKLGFPYFKHWLLPTMGFLHLALILRDRCCFFLILHRVY